MGLIQTQHFRTKDGQGYTIRNLVESDAIHLIEFGKTHGFDPRYAVTMADEFNMTIDDEVRWIQGYLTNENALGIVAEARGNIIGLLNFFPKKPKRMAHTGSFGITVHTDFRERGVGTELLKILIGWGKNSSQIEKILLGVLATNQRAIAFYKKMGFIEEGLSLRALKNPDGSYVDDISMALWVKSS